MSLNTGKPAAGRQCSFSSQMAKVDKSKALGWAAIHCLFLSLISMATVILTSA